MVSGEENDRVSNQSGLAPKSPYFRTGATQAPMRIASDLFSEPLYCQCTTESTYESPSVVPSLSAICISIPHVQDLFFLAFRRIHVRSFVRAPGNCNLFWPSHGPSPVPLLESCRRYSLKHRQFSPTWTACLKN